MRGNSRTERLVLIRNWVLVMWRRVIRYLGTVRIEALLQRQQLLTTYYITSTYVGISKLPVIMDHSSHAIHPDIHRYSRD